MSQMNIKVEEYKSLHSSIDMHMKLIPEILAFMVAATGALLGYGINTKNALICLAPLLVIYPCAYLIQSQMEEVLRKGAYIMKQYEQEEQLWETALYKDRQKRKKGKRYLFTKAAGDSRAIVIIIDCLVVLCFVGFVGFLSPLVANAYLKMVYAAIGAIAILVVTYILPKFPIRGILKAYTSEKEKDFLKKMFSE
jgi:uncharacterized membrane protein